MSQCPPLDQLEQLLEERLPDKEQRDCAAHVSRCRACQALLEGLTDTQKSSFSHTAVLGRQEKAKTAKEPLSPFLARLKEMSAFAILAADRMGESCNGAATWYVAPQNLSTAAPVVPGYEILSE